MTIISKEKSILCGGFSCVTWNLNPQPHVVLIPIPQETLSEGLHKQALVSKSTVLKQLMLNLLAWTLCVGLTIGSCASIYFLQCHQEQLVGFFFILVCQYTAVLKKLSVNVEINILNNKRIFPQGPDISGFSNDLIAEASTLLLPVVVSLINLIVPLTFSFINKMETYANPRTYIYIGIMR